MNFFSSSNSTEISSKFLRLPLWGEVSVGQQLASLRDIPAPWPADVGTGDHIDANFRTDQ